MGVGRRPDAVPRPKENRRPRVAAATHVRDNRDRFVPPFDIQCSKPRICFEAGILSVVKFGTSNGNEEPQKLSWS